MVRLFQSATASRGRGGHGTALLVAEDHRQVKNPSRNNKNFGNVHLQQGQHEEEYQRQRQMVLREFAAMTKFHTQQQRIIWNELTTSRQILSEENQQLREDLDGAITMIKSLDKANKRLVRQLDKEIKKKQEKRKKTNRRRRMWDEDYDDDSEVADDDGATTTSKSTVKATGRGVRIMSSDGRSVSSGGNNSTRKKKKCRLPPRHMNQSDFSGAVDLVPQQKRGISLFGRNRRRWRRQSSLKSQARIFQNPLPPGQKTVRQQKSQGGSNDIKSVVTRSTTGSDVSGKDGASSSGISNKSSNKSENHNISASRKSGKKKIVAAKKTRPGTVPAPPGATGKCNTGNVRNKTGPTPSKSHRRNKSNQSWITIDESKGSNSSKRLCASSHQSDDSNDEPSETDKNGSSTALALVPRSLVAERVRNFNNYGLKKSDQERPYEKKESTVTVPDRDKTTGQAAPIQNISFRSKNQLKGKPIAEANRQLHEPQHQQRQEEIAAKVMSGLIDSILHDYSQSFADSCEGEDDPSNTSSLSSGSTPNHQAIVQNE